MTQHACWSEACLASSLLQKQERKNLDQEHFYRLKTIQDTLSPNRIEEIERKFFSGNRKLLCEDMYLFSMMLFVEQLRENGVPYGRDLYDLCQSLLTARQQLGPQESESRSEIFMLIERTYLLTMQIYYKGADLFEAYEYGHGDGQGSMIMNNENYQKLLKEYKNLENLNLVDVNNRVEIQNRIRLTANEIDKLERNFNKEFLNSYVLNSDYDNKLSKKNEKTREDAYKLKPYQHLGIFQVNQFNNQQTLCGKISLLYPQGHNSNDYRKQQLYNIQIAINYEWISKDACNQILDNKDHAYIFHDVLAYGHQFYKKDSNCEINPFKFFDILKQANITPKDLTEMDSEKYKTLIDLCLRPSYEQLPNDNGNPALIECIQKGYLQKQDIIELSAQKLDLIVKLYERYQQAPNDSVKYIVLGQKAVEA